MKQREMIKLAIIICMLWIIPAHANLLTNGSFEDGDTGQITTVPIPGWSTWNYSGWHHNDAGAVINTKAVKLWGTDSGIYQNFAATAGNTYRLSGYMLHTSGDPLRGGDKSGDFRAEWYNASNTMLREDAFGKITSSDPTNTWLSYSADITAPAGTAYGRVLIRMYRPSSGDGAVNYDNVSVDSIQNNDPDYNNDFHVDLADYRFLSTSWQKTAAQYDLNGDNTININDLIIFAQSWLTWQDPGNARTIAIDPATTFQEIKGFGASLTDSSAWLIYMFLNASERQAVLTDLFDPVNGIGLSYLRQPMGASDLRLAEYTYDDRPSGQTDYNLTYFNVTYDQQYIIPTLQQILAINPNVKIMGSPWSPPAWMKDSGQIGGGHLKSDVYTAYANYFVKYIQAYAANGIPVDAVTLQNEPYLEPWTYGGCRMEPADQIKLVKLMGPAFAANGIATKIIVWDHNWDNTAFALSVLSDAVARPYIDGVAWHHYAGDVSAQTTVHNAYPDKNTYFTEGSDGTWNDDGFDADLIRNGTFVIDTLRNWAKTVVKWNLALDQNNGPKIAGGCDTCYGVVTINRNTRQVTPKPHYYALGHASKFLSPGAVRIASSDGTIRTVAFKNMDGSVVLYAVNTNSSADILKLVWNSQWVISNIPARSIMTFRWNNELNAKADVYLSTGDHTSLLEHRSPVYFHN
jgi:glucosylceramidase